MKKKELLHKYKEDRKDRFISDLLFKVNIASVSMSEKTGLSTGFCQKIVMRDIQKNMKGGVPIGKG